jgi:hypothetical protein
MDFRTAVKSAGCMFFFLCAVVTAIAATIGASYAYTLDAITGNPANPPLLGSGNGLLLPLGSMSWNDRAFPEATGAFTGTFTMTFANGTLFGDFHGQSDITAPLTAIPITQVLNVTGGTGAFIWYNGTLTGMRFSTVSQSTRKLPAPEL